MRRTLTATLALIALVLTAAATGATRHFADQERYDALRSKAEAFHEGGAFSKSRRAYQEAAKLSLPEAETRWVSFRLADTRWRIAAAAETADSSEVDGARGQLDKLVRDVPEADRDDLWAEVQESLGDWWWMRPQTRNWHQAWTHYQLALSHWARSTNLDQARDRYLSIVRRAAEPPHADDHYIYGWWGNQLPLDVVQSAVGIAETKVDRAQAHYLLAMTLRHQGGWEHRRKVVAAFEEAVALGRGTGWYDDALYQFGQWMEQSGKVERLENGQFRNRPDYLRARQLYRQLAREFRKGESRHRDDAIRREREIARTVVGLGVPNVYAPKSEVELQLSWRNAERVDLRIVAVDLSRDPSFGSGQSGTHDWIAHVDLDGGTRVRNWSVETDDDGRHEPGNRPIRVDGALEAGAYIVEARAGAVTARDLILVTDAALVLVNSGDAAVAYLADAVDGSPVPGADLRLSEHWWDGKQHRWAERRARADDQGLARFELRGDANRAEIFVGARAGDRQAFALGGAYSRSRSDRPEWKIYAWTDRPAYRPGEEIQWKLAARTWDGIRYSTPARQALHWRIVDPRGAEVAKGEGELSDFGSTWGALASEAKFALGEYYVELREGKQGRHLGRATLFRLEEYVLPAFEVSVRTPEENGTPKTFLLGDSVETEISAAYYSGGPVANAKLEVVVEQRPFWRTWRPVREHPWLFEDVDTQPQRHWGGGNVVKREVLRTDAAGKATVRFDTPIGGGQDFQYRIEARVTDAARTEVAGEGNVRVTRQPFYVDGRARHSVRRPQDLVEIDWRAEDANGRPMPVEGQVRVTRERWVEAWMSPRGERVAGAALTELRERLAKRQHIFPPPPGPDGLGWRLVHRGYESEEVLKRQLRTGADGLALFAFTAAAEGYYRVTWTTEREDALPVTAQAQVWVATKSSTDLGYRSGQLELLVDRDSFRAGDTARVVVSVAGEDRWVLLGVEGEGLHDLRLVHVAGRLQFLEIPIVEEHVPNVFLNAVMVADRQVHRDVEAIVVPPVEHFIDVEVSADREAYEPGESGRLSIVARDHRGEPVAAEVGLALVDESVFYVQGDYAGDPRKFFFGTKRQHQVQTQSSFQQKAYAQPQTRSESEVGAERERFDRDGAFADSISSKEEGRMVGFASNEAMPASAPAERMAGGRYRALAKAKKSQISNLAERSQSKDDLAGGSGGGDEMDLAEIRVRSDFRSTILWSPDLVTDAEGRASVEVSFPDSLTRWQASARAFGRGSQVGMGTGKTRTRLPLEARLRTPRFFVVGDRSTVTGVLRNGTEAELRVTPRLQSSGLEIKGFRVAGRDGRGVVGELAIPAGGEVRVDWHVAAEAAGAASLQLEARAAKPSEGLGEAPADGMTRSVPIHEHGIEKLVARSGKLRSDPLTLALELPAARRATELDVVVAPSLAVAMLDALPYLIDFPYGCTEQTLSRFLPAAIVTKALADLGLDASEIEGRLFGGIEVKHAAQTHPKAKKGLGRLDAVVQAGLQRLADFQHADGGWGWWKGGESDHFMSAYVLWGLSLAQQAGMPVNRDVIYRGGVYLAGELVEAERQPDLQAWMLRAVAQAHVAVDRKQIGEWDLKAIENLWGQRRELKAYTRALFALALHSYGQSERAREIVQLLEDGVRLDQPDQSRIQKSASANVSTAGTTAHWGNVRMGWRWSEGAVESTATVLRALLAIDPKNELVEPAAAWLVQNRRGAQWSHTRDTALSILALTDYLRVSGELEGGVAYSVRVNGRPVSERAIGPGGRLAAPSRIRIPADLVRDQNEIRVERTAGEGPLYVSVEARFTSLEEPITPAGNGLFVQRSYEKLVPRETLLDGVIYEKAPLEDGGSVASGERVSVRLRIEAKNDLEYLVFEDLKPAGFEAVQIRSGESIYVRELRADALDREDAAAVAEELAEAAPMTAAAAKVRQSVARAIGTMGIRPPTNGGSGDAKRFTGRSRWVHQELRDRKVALFIDKLPQGVWEIEYDLRAEVPGHYHGLPVLGEAMYVPEIRANGAEVRVSVVEAADSASE